MKLVGISLLIIKSSCAFQMQSLLHLNNLVTIQNKVRYHHGLTSSSTQNMHTSLRKTRSSILFSTPTNARNTNTSFDDTCDVLVLGSGPAARAIATLISSSSSTSKKSLDVILADSNYDRKWAPNFGVWEDEWFAICKAYQSEFNRLLPDEECINRRWGVTDCYFGGSYGIPVEERMRLNKPYYRIEKDGLQEALSPPSTSVEGESWYRVIKANHVASASSINIYSPPGTLVHDEDGSTIQLQPKGKTSRPITVRTKLIIDCTGHETDLVLKDSKVKSIPPGFQIAYGALVTVDEKSSPNLSKIGPYDKEAMTLFDYRTDHFDNDSIQLQKASNAPTFMYAMPIKDNLIFFEETSLVARPALSFQECKNRFLTRMKHLGVKIDQVLEEEYCYIPMGGPLPDKNQRVIAFGGASAMVHPSTGYNLCRNMMGACAVAKVIKDGLLKNDGATKINLDKISASSYHAMWSPDNIRQRNFAVFGGEFLMKQKVEGLRGFFDGFFALPVEMWAGFLAGWPGLPNNEKHDSWNARLLFGLTFVSKLPFPVAADMLASIVTYSISEGIALPQSVTPFFGKPASYEYVERPMEQGDVAAKAEARKMIMESKVEDVIPVAFSEIKK